MKPWFQIFIAGWIACTAIRSLQQDMIGKDGYIELVRNGWVSGWITVPIAIFMFFLAWRLVSDARKKLLEIE